MAKKEKDDWVTKKWRPMMGWTYMATCLFDFMLGPILYNILQYYNPGQAVGMWTPLTLQGGGMYHIAMGAIIGVSAFGRTQEKLAVTNSPDPVPMQPVMMQAPAPTYAPAPNFSGYQQPAAPAFAPAPAAFDQGQGGFNSQPTGFGNDAPQSFDQGQGGFNSQPTGFGNDAPQSFDVTSSGKKIIPNQQQPEL